LPRPNHRQIEFYNHILHTKRYLHSHTRVLTCMHACTRACTLTCTHAHVSARKHVHIQHYVKLVRCRRNYFFVQR